MDIACETACGPDAALKKWATELELRHSAERRHLFWRNRCLEHARTIDKQNNLICHLRESRNELNALRETFDAATAALQNVVDNVCRRMIESGGVVEGVDFNALQVGLSSVISKAESIRESHHCNEK